jgi:hypothetical protein
MLWFRKHFFQFSLLKLVKVAENCDHNIDPCSGPQQNEGANLPMSSTADSSLSESSELDSMSLVFSRILRNTFVFGSSFGSGLGRRRFFFRFRFSSWGRFNKSVWAVTYVTSLVQHTKTGKNEPTIHKIYQMSTIPNGRKIEQMAIKCSNIFHCKTLRNLSKSGFSVLKYANWQPWLSSIVYAIFWTTKIINIDLYGFKWY